MYILLSHGSSAYLKAIRLIIFFLFILLLDFIIILLWLNLHIFHLVFDLIWLKIAFFINYQASYTDSSKTTDNCYDCYWSFRWIFLRTCSWSADPASAIGYATTRTGKTDDSYVSRGARLAIRTCHFLARKASTVLNNLAISTWKTGILWRTKACRTIFMALWSYIASSILVKTIFRLTCLCILIHFSVRYGTTTQTEIRIKAGLAIMSTIQTSCMWRISVFFSLAKLTNTPIRLNITDRIYFEGARTRTSITIVKITIIALLHTDYCEGVSTNSYACILIKYVASWATQAGIRINAGQAIMSTVQTSCMWRISVFFSPAKLTNTPICLNSTNRICLEGARARTSITVQKITIIALLHTDYCEGVSTNSFTSILIKYIASWASYACILIKYIASWASYACISGRKNWSSEATCAKRRWVCACTTQITTRLSNRIVKTVIKIAI